MPLVSVKAKALCEALGKDVATFSADDFQVLCFQYGLELDEVTTVGSESKKQSVVAAGAAAAGLDDVSAGEEDEVVWKVEIAANRYDILCLEGLARALRIFTETEEPPIYRALAPPSLIRMTVQPATGLIRPHVVGAVLRGMTFTKAVYKSFIDLQDKLHQNICRGRRLVAIGTHDLDTLKPPFSYEALPPEAIEFIPLTQTRPFTADKLMEFYRTETSVKHIKPYTDIIYDSPVYPIIYDSERTVLSLPPIINGEHSKIVEGKTRDVFIECTATDLTKAKIVLNTMVTMFSEYCADPFTVEPVEVVLASGSSMVTPDLESRKAACSVEELNNMLGTSLEPGSIIDYCKRMQLSNGTYDPSTDCVTVDVPPTRSDILHECDIIEDVAVAVGFQKIKPKIPATATVGKQLPINAFSDKLRFELASAGYTECLTMGLSSRAENFSFLRRTDDGSAVGLANPKTIEYEVVRTSLMPGLLKTLSSNRTAKISEGLRIFEVSDIVRIDDTADVGARNHRHLSAMYCSLSSGFEVIHGLVDRIMEVCEIRPHYEFEVVAGWVKGEDADDDDDESGKEEDVEESKEVPDRCQRYRLVPVSDPSFLEGRCAQVVVDTPVGDEGDEVTSVVVGILGIVHPECLAAFKVTYPVAAVEMYVEKLM